MDWSLAPQEVEFRDACRAWLAENVPRVPPAAMDSAAGFAAHREWERRLYTDRWGVVSWPEEYGGRGASLVEWLLFEEEYYAAGAPGRVSQNGIFLLAPTLLAFGTEEQRRRFLPPMAAGEEIWAQAWSEPQAGSDLAALRSRARRVDGGWVLSGQKTWTTRGAFADWGFGLFRSDPDAERHRGLTYMLFPLDAEGITVQPVRRLDGAPGFAEVFFDEVFVADGQVLGEVGAGWEVAMATTAAERGLVLRSPGRFLAAARDLIDLRGRVGAAADGTGTAAAVDCLVDAASYRARALATAGLVAGGEKVGPESSIDKLFWSELDLRIHRAALDLLGPAAELADGPAAVDRGRWLDGYLFALAGPIYAGTNEIQRGIVAQRVLGMARR